MEDIKEWCGLRAFAVLHLWAPRHSNYLTDLHSSWYKVQRGTIACRKINTALLGESVSNSSRGTALVQCRVQEIESSPMLTLEIAECLIHILGVGRLWQNWGQTIRARNLKQWQRWFLKLSDFHKPKFQCHFLLLVELNYRTRLDSGFPVST